MAGARGDLAAADCHAVVVGTGRYGTGGAQPLSPLPGAAHSAADLARVLRENCGMEDRVTLVLDPEGPTEVLAAVQDAIDASEGGVVLFCFAGHGLLGPGRQLYLATAGTASASDTVRAVPYDQISKRLADSAATPVVVLDCCFSGLAQAAPQESYRELLTSARPEGSFLLSSATHYAASFAPAGQRHTLFSGELLRLLTEGDPGGPAWLTFLDVYRILDHRFQGGPARPHSEGVGLAADLVIVRNAGRPAGGEDPDGAVGQSEGPCPYPGMRPFLPEQRHLFFGREELTRSLLARVTGDDDRGPIVLVGASGAGKSSLLRAGLVAGLERERVLLLPGVGSRPFRTLAERWAAATGRAFSEVEGELGAGRFGPDGPDVLVVDQLEELFTQCQDDEERELFLRAVTGSSARRPRIVLGLRADFYGQCLADARLARVLRNGQFTVAAMSDDELRAAVERPADHAGLRLEDGLAEHLLRELRQERAAEGDAVALPFLAHALQETWARRRGDQLTFAGYQATGGIRTSVIRTADQVHDELDDDGRRRLRELLLRMVVLVDDGPHAARRRIAAENLDGAGDLLGRLVAARLVVVDRGEAQLCHDSLLYGWPKLREWIDQDRSGLVEHRRLATAADRWHAAGRPDSELYEGPQLAVARARLAPGPGTPLPLRPVERDFLRAGAARQNRRRRAFRMATAVIAVLAVLAGTLAVLFRGAQEDAEGRETVLIANQLAGQADAVRGRDPQTALRLSLAAYRVAETPQTRSSLYAAYLSQAPVELAGAVREPVLNIGFSADGDVLATSQRRGRVQLWDISRRNEPSRVAHLGLDGSAAIAFHPRDRLLAAQTATRLSLWDVTDPARPREIATRPVAEGTTHTLAFSPDGRTLAAAGAGGRLRLWDVSRPSAPRLRTDRPVAATTIISLAFGRDGLLVTGNGRSGAKAEDPAEVRLWRVTDPARPELLDTAAAESVMAVAFHPKRDLVVATGGESRMGWWTVEGGRRLVAVGPKESYERTWGYGGSLPSLSFRPDGGRLAAANAEGAGGAWLRNTAGSGAEPADGQAEEGTVPGGEPAQAVAYSPDGSHLAVGDVGGNVRAWPERAPAPRLAGRIWDGDPGTSPVSEDGRFALTKGTDATRVWDLSTADTAEGADPRLHFTLPEGWEARYFLPGRDGPLLLAHRWTDGSKDHVFRVWDLGGGGPPVQGAPFTVTASDVRSAVSGDGRLFAVGGWTGTLLDVWDLTDVRNPVRRSRLPVTPLAEPESLFFLGDRALAVVEGDENTVGRPRDLRVWDLGDPEKPHRGPKLEGVAESRAAYIPSTRLLISDDSAERAQLWDMTDVRAPRKAARLPAASGGYQPVGRSLLATTLLDGTVRFWDVADPYEPRELPRMRFDRFISSITPAPDGERVLTGEPYRIWETDGDGRWRTPAVATLEGAKELRLLPEKSPFMAVLPYDADSNALRGQSTYLLDHDTDRVYARLCRTHPLSVEPDQWQAMLPHLSHRRSCG
ncbi:caspase family protein [Streptomyces sp. NPDC058052]|uniref:caspase, EACC1-associated type n=1 Tax=Streptomyces sp. NPDC058052 TaxID=3346316 RepID=UPI0036E5E614